MPFFLSCLLAGCYNDAPDEIIRISETKRAFPVTTIEIQTKDTSSVFIQYWPKGSKDSIFVSDTSEHKTTHHIGLGRLRQDQVYEYQVFVPGKKDPIAGIRSFSTGEIPVGFSDQVHLMEADLKKLPGSFQKGLVMLYRRDLPGFLCIVNGKGNIVWYQSADSTGYKVASYTPRHTILALMAPLSYPTSYGNEIVETKLNGDTVLHLKKGEKGFDKTIHHELFYNNAGQLVTLTLDQRVVDLSKAGGSRADTVKGDGILVLDKNGNKIWEWSVFDVLDPAAYPGILQEKNDWLHANSLSIDRDGNYIVSFYLGRQIWKIDARTGKLLWRLGKNGDFTLRSGAWFTESHTVYRNDNNELVLFENGTTGKRSSVLVYKIDEAKRQASLRMKIPLAENLYSQRMGSAYAMGDSAWLVCTAQSGNVVVTDDKGAVLWRLRTGFIPYRATFIPAADLWPSPHPPGQANASSQDKPPGDVVFDSAAVPQNPYGAAILYGRRLIMNTASYIGPAGANGHYLGNNMSCNNCHQNGGIKPGSFSLVHSHDEYPQYRAREAKILSLADRVNNCINRPMNGKSLPYDSREMIALLSYLKWINDTWKEDKRFDKSAHTSFRLTDTAASPQRGATLYQENCSRCHGGNGEGIMNKEHNEYIYPPLWGGQSYQAGSSLHRVIKMAGWLKGNMPYDKAISGRPFLTDQQALDLAAFINDDELHRRPVPVGQKDYPDIHTKPVDYGHGPYIDSFPQVQHKFGPYPPIIDYLKSRGLNASY